MSHEEAEKIMTIWRQSESGNDQQCQPFRFSDDWKSRGNSFDEVFMIWQVEAKNKIPHTYRFDDATKDDIVNQVWEKKIIKYFELGKQTEFQVLSTWVNQVCINIYEERKKITLGFNTTGELSDFKEHLMVTGTMKIKGDRNPETDPQKLHYHAVTSITTPIIETFLNRFTYDGIGEIVERNNREIEKTILKFYFIAREKSINQSLKNSGTDNLYDAILKKIENSRQFENQINIGMLQRIRELTVL